MQHIRLASVSQAPCGDASQSAFEKDSQGGFGVIHGASDQPREDIVFGYFPAFRDRDEDWWRTHIAPEFVRHDPRLDFEVRGVERVKRLAALLHGGFPDTEYPIVQVVAEGDRVLAHLQQVATHSGEYQSVSATVTRTDIEVMNLFRVFGDDLVEN